MHVDIGSALGDVDNAFGNASHQGSLLWLRGLVTYVGSGVDAEQIVRRTYEPPQTGPLQYCAPFPCGETAPVGSRGVARASAASVVPVK